MRKRSYTGAVIAAICLLLYYSGMLALFLRLPGIPLMLKLALCLIPLALGGLVIYVLSQRVRELKSGETDDLDNY